jgi:hypothetical protein
MDLGTLANWAAVLVALAAIVISLAGNRAKALAAKIARLYERVDTVEDRVIKMESLIAHLPNKESTHRLEVSMTELRAEVQVLTERIKPVAAVSERLQAFLLERAER